MDHKSPHKEKNQHLHSFRDQNALRESMQSLNKLNTEELCRKELKNLGAIFKKFERYQKDMKHKTQLRVFYNEFKGLISKLAYENKDLKDMLKALYILHLNEKDKNSKI